MYDGWWGWYLAFFLVRGENLFGWIYDVPDSAYGLLIYEGAFVQSRESVRGWLRQGLLMCSRVLGGYTMTGRRDRSYLRRNSGSAKVQAIRYTTYEHIPSTVCTCADPASDPTCQIPLGDAVSARSRTSRGRIAPTGPTLLKPLQLPSTPRIATSTNRFPPWTQRGNGAINLYYEVIGSRLSDSALHEALLFRLPRHHAKVHLHPLSVADSPTMHRPCPGLELQLGIFL